MFISITNAQDGFHRHHNAKPSVRRSVLYYQFLFLVFVLGGWPSGRRRKHATTNIWTSVPNIINFCFRGPAVPAAAKTRKSQYLDCCTRQLFIFSLCSPPSVHVNQYAAGNTPIINLIQASYCQKTCRTYTSGVFHPIC